MRAVPPNLMLTKGSSLTVRHVHVVHVYNIGVPEQASSGLVPLDLELVVGDEPT